MTKTVTFTRTYPAPPEKVFAAWTEVELLTTWFGCAPDMLWVVHEWDPVPDGKIHVSLDFETGPYEVRGRFMEVIAPDRLVYEWENDQIVTVTFTAVADGTEMTLEHAGLPNDEMCEIVTGGWTDGIGRLVEVVM